MKKLMMIPAIAVLLGLGSMMREPTTARPALALSASDDVFPPASGVLAKFEFNGNVLDSGGHGRHATLLGGEFVPTDWGQGLYIFATDPFGFEENEPMGIDWSAFAGLLIHPYTIEVVLTPEATDCWHKLFGFDDADDNGWYYCSEGIQAWPYPIVGVGQVLAGERHYLAFVSTAADQVDVYFQGALLGSTNASFTAPGPEAIFFRDDSTTGRFEQIDGVVEALRISGVTRTPGEMATIQQRLAAQAQIDALIEQVEDLVSAGGLNQGQGNSLTQKLDSALDAVKRGNLNAACNKLDAFVNQVDAFINAGLLTSAQGQALIDAANGVKSSIGC